MSIPVSPAEVPVVRRLSTLDRFLPLWIFAAMALGILLGRVYPGLGAALDRVQVAGVSVPIVVGPRRTWRRRRGRRARTAPDPVARRRGPSGRGR